MLVLFYITQTHNILGAFLLTLKLCKSKLQIGNMSDENMGLEISSHITFKGRTWVIQKVYFIKTAMKRLFFYIADGGAH